MAVTQSGTSVTGGGHPPIRTSRFRGIWLWTTIAALMAAIDVTATYAPSERGGQLELGCSGRVHEAARRGRVGRPWSRGGRR
jgi:hypothetical protein